MVGEDETWPCGHPRTDENTRSVGKAGKRCRLCRIQIDAKRKRKEPPVDD
jgi:hypothetical protein